MGKESKTVEVPKGLEAFAWNVGLPLDVWGRAYVALEALETANERLWRKVPPGWFNAAFAKRHGRPATKRIILISAVEKVFKAGMGQ